MTILTIITLILVSFAGIIPNKVSPVWYPQLIVFSICLFIYIGLTLWRLNKWLVLFLSYCLFSVIFSDLFYALSNINLPTLKHKIAYGLLSFGKINPRALIILYHLYLCSYMAYAISFLKWKQRKYVTLTIACIVGINTLWAFLQYFNIDPIFHSIKNIKVDYVVGFMGSWNCFSSYLAMGSPLILAASPFLIIPVLIAIVLSKSWYALVVTSIITLIYIINYKKKLLLIFVPLLLLVTSFMVLKYDKISLDAFTKRDRVGLWKTSIQSILKGQVEVRDKVIKCNSLFGYGLGNFPTIISCNTSDAFNTQNTKYNHAHNDGIEIFFELGYIGLILLILLLLSIVKRFIRTVKTKEFKVLGLCLLSYFLCSNAYFVSHMPVTGLMLIVFYGLFEAIRRENGETTKVCEG